MSTPSSESVSALESTAADEARAERSSELDVSDEPLVTIEPGGAFSMRDLRDLWLYRELFYFLVWRDLKVRYKQTALGIAWVVMQPLASAFVFTIFLGMLARVPSGDLPYPLLAFSGLALWTFFSGAVMQSANSLIGNSHLITKVYFPRMLIPAAAVGARLFDFAVAFLVLLAMMAFYGTPPGWSALFLLAPIVLAASLALGIGIWGAAINVKYRDVGVVLPVALQLWMFASPVVYPSTLVPEKWRWLYSLNPFAGIVEGFRAALFGRPFDWASFGAASLVTFATLIVAVYFFRRMEKSFADVI